MEFIELVKSNNKEDAYYKIKSLKVEHLSEIDDTTIKQLITEGINKLSISNCNKILYYSGYSSDNYYTITLVLIEMQFIKRREITSYELPRIIRIYKEVMKEQGFKEQEINKMEYL